MGRFFWKTTGTGYTEGRSDIGSPSRRVIRPSVVSEAFSKTLNEGLDSAERDVDVLLIVGRPGRFSAWISGETYGTVKRRLRGGVGKTVAGSLASI